MKRNKIVSIYVAFVGAVGGKRRPVLVIENNENELLFYSITSKYKNKSEAIKNSYFRITDWQDSGLKKESWVDTGNLLILSKHETDFQYKDIGELTENDLNRLEIFLDEYYKKGRA